MKYVYAMFIWCIGIILLGIIFRINFELFAFGWGLVQP